MLGNFDLHIHTTASDGSDTPRALAGKIAGLELFSVTDHDTIEGALAMEDLVPDGACRGCSDFEDLKARLPSDQYRIPSSAGPAADGAYPAAAAVLHSGRPGIGGSRGHSCSLKCGIFRQA